MKEQQDKLWTRGFLFVTLSNFLLFLNLQMILPAMPSYAKEHFAASDFTASLVTSLFAMAAIVSRVFAGQMLQKGKRNLILFFGIGIAMLATLGYTWCGVIGALLLMRMLYGVGFGMASTTFPTMASNVVPPKRMGEGMGYFGLSTTLAMSIGPTIGLTLLGQYGFGTLIGGAMLILLVLVPLAVTTVRILPAQAPAPSTHQAKSQWFDRKLLLPSALHFLLSVTYGGLLSFLALFGKEVSIAHVGNFFLFNALAIVLIRPLAGKIFDKKGHVAIMLPGGLLTVVGMAVLSYSTTMTGLFVAAMFYGVGFGMLQPSIQAWMIKEVSPEQRGMANGMFLNSLDLGVAFGSMLLGAVAMSTSYTVMYRVAAGFMVAFLLLYSLYLFSQNLRSKVRA